MNHRYALSSGIWSRLLAAAVMIVTQSAHADSLVMADQGPAWTDSARKAFYSGNQGSRLMPLAWLNALKQADGQPFLADSLSRYGYLPNDSAPAPGLPVGFTLDRDGTTVGITCAACHTRQIEVGGKAYRIDGGPAISDFQNFAADLDAAVGKVLSDSAVFADFAQGVLGAGGSPGQQAALKTAVQEWYAPYHTIMERGLPRNNPWGYGRLDAVSMIFNRVSGLDIGPPPGYLIPENIVVADAPVRYPFLWNAAIQDKTQWPGFADNGDNLLALARNIGEVYGVFGDFHPKRDPDRLLGIDYLAINSADFRGLDDLEYLIQKLRPPKWPWSVDQILAGAGKAVYNRTTALGGCIDCHGIKPGQPQLLNLNTWATPVQDVGTDAHEYAVLRRQVKTGVLEGARIPLIAQQPLKPVDFAASLLGTAVRGAILQHAVPVRLGSEVLARSDQLETLIGKQIKAMEGIYRLPPPPSQTENPGFAYESRVLEGIWATAPYLHNGSVRSLAELLKPATERIAEFRIGPAYDPVNIGLAEEQPHFSSTLKTSGDGNCYSRDRQLDAGNSRCGHEYGVQLSPDDKKALLEYLKTL